MARGQYRKLRRKRQSLLFHVKNKQDSEPRSWLGSNLRDTLHLHPRYSGRRSPPTRSYTSSRGAYLWTGSLGLRRGYVPGPARPNGTPDTVPRVIRPKIQGPNKPPSSSRVPFGCWHERQGSADRPLFGRALPRDLLRRFAVGSCLSSLVRSTQDEGGCHLGSRSSDVVFYRYPARKRMAPAWPARTTITSGTTITQRGPVLPTPLGRVEFSSLTWRCFT